MQFKQYPSYKPSGVEWLGDVPEHWQIVRTKDIFNHRKEEALADDEIVTAFRDGQVTLRKNRRTDGFTNSIKEHGYQHINSGDLVIHEMDAFAGAIGVSDSSGKSTPVYTVCYAKNENINHHFYSHFFRTMAKTGFINSLAKGIRVRSTEFRWNESRNVYLVEPPKADQEKIVSFLDTETARIDNLISKQEKLIELLEEQRKSIISHAVTKGLNPNVPMKDSGVEWLGQVPEHWMTPSSKHLLEIPITDGPHETPNFVDDGIPFISAEAISKGKIDFDKKRGYITPELNAIYSKKYSPKVEDIYMVKSGATTGKVAMVETTETFNIWSPLAVFRCNKNKVLPKFLLAVFNSSHFYDALVLNWSYGTQQNIGMGVLSNIEIPCPPLKEQAEIIQHLDVQNTKFDKLIGTQSQLIEKLKEYRSSIISHAVTGKIDVREFY
ncbi:MULTISPECIES: restriction endonuclease subunit S [Acinetobacter calcoaceticus/baumannii complex]|uniref:Restriction endonuclease subunit S n=1 Tax=Acinetobacter baumannii TaxID=470 RepID=A0A7S8ZW00_ACIBA|nr:restriction endonuclease subunit S [Acinetobacter baumannii]QPF15340.1 restriction endonuclease subunit S [Acinetobacter baumannii]HEN9589425.1 restriction endonuclease subunit S [Acinetobacter baumannii]HEO1774540.1 restriction endonuclease subunit S [Acinetobacter baumannii]HEO1790450.1 restriction endonuclease subunit S [Acinetobacter baumannii]HEO1793641.1 restriction endonuclease subunit S [Acinetobacter baumannii]